MKRRTLLSGMASLPLVSLVPTGSTQAAELTKAYSGQTLSILMGSGGVFDTYVKVSKEFTSATGINLQFTSLSYGEQYQKLILDLTSGTNSLDVYEFAYQWKYEVAPFSADMRAAAKVPTAPDLALDDFPGDILKVYGLVDDKLVGLPCLGDITLMVWNKEQYKAVGLDPTVAPSSWDEVYERGVKLNTGGHAGFGLPGGKDIQTACLWILLFAANGGVYFDDKHNPQFDSDAGHKAMSFLVDKLQTIAPAGNLTWDFPEMLNGLTTGKSAQSMMWPGGFGDLLNPAQSSTAHEVAWAPTPSASLLGGWSLGVNDSSPAKEAALLYVSWFTSAETQLKMSALGAPPARKSVLANPDLAKKYAQFPAVLAGMSGPVTQYPPVQQSEQVNIMIFNEVNAALAGVKTVDQAVADLQSNVKAFVIQTGYLKA